MIRTPEVVGVEEGHELSARETQPVVARGAALGVLLPDVAEAIAPIILVTFDDGRRVVGRAVVNDYDLDLRARLRERGLNRQRQVARAVVGRNDYARERRLHTEEDSESDSKKLLTALLTS